MAALASAVAGRHLPQTLSWVIERGAVDFAFWCEFWLGVVPFPHQVRWGIQRARRAYCVAGAQSGKSLGAALSFLWEMWHRPRTEYLNCSITFDQAKIVFEEAVKIARASRRFEPFIKDIVYSPFPTLDLTDGSSLTARSMQRDGKFVRGHKYWGVNYDEIAYGKQKEVDQVLTQRVIQTAGWVRGMTTPKGKNWLYHESVRTWRTMNRQLGEGRGIRELTRFFQRQRTEDNPTIPRDGIEDARQSLSENDFRQEYMAEFVEMEGTLFREGDVVAITDRELNGDAIDPLTKAERQPEPDPAARYVVGWDLARKQAWTVGIILRVDKRPWVGQRIVRMRRAPWPEICGQMDRLNRAWRVSGFFDATGIGDVVGGWLRYPLEEYPFSQRTKYELLESCRDAVERHLLRLPFWDVLYDKMLAYSWSEEAEDDDEHWDEIMALALAVWAARKWEGGGPTIEAGGRRRSLREIEAFTAPGRGRRSPTDDFAS